MNPENPSENALSGLKLLFVEFLIVAIVIAIALSILNYFNILSLSSFSPNLFARLPQEPQTVSQQPITLPPPTQQATAAASFPLTSDNPNVKETSILYRLQGVVSSLTTTKNVTYITFQQSTNAIPPIQVLGNATVKQEQQSGRLTLLQPTTLKDLQENQSISLSAIYDPVTKKWTTYYIVILLHPVTSQ